MATIQLLFLFLSVLVSTEAGKLSDRSPTSECVPPDMSSFYNYATKDLEGNYVPLDIYRDHVVLVVNVATFSRFAEQYKGLNNLMDEVQGNKEGKCGLIVLAFPSNQIGYKEPASNATQFRKGLMYVNPGDGFVPKFPIFNKVILNGEKEDPIFTYLKTRCPTPSQVNYIKGSNFTFKSSDIRGNFEKVLVNYAGHPVKRYLSTVKPLDILDDIKKLSLKCHSAAFFSNQGHKAAQGSQSQFDYPEHQYPEHDGGYGYGK